MTELEAVNVGIRLLGEQPVTSLTDPLIEITGLYQELQLTHDEVARRGWQSFNIKKNLEIPKNFNTNTEWSIDLTDQYYRVDPSYQHGLVVRWNGTRNTFYNTRTNVWEDINGDSVNCDVIERVDFEDCPEVYQDYVALKTARRVLLRLHGTTDVYQVSAQEELEKDIRLQEFESDLGDQTLFNSNSQIMSGNYRVKNYGRRFI